MKQVLIRQGHAVVEQVPAPQVEDGTVLVRVQYSCISIGTEMSGVRASGAPLWKRAMQQPDNVRAVMDLVGAHGVSTARTLVQGKLAAGAATGYSAAGVVLAVGAGVTDLFPGDRVACAGAQSAYHAEVIRVPRNLVVPIPDGVEMADASTVTLGAIAMQGVRRASPTLGETFVVVGLGILGQLTAQFLQANGCRVVGVDLDRERIRQGIELGMDVGLHPDDSADVDQVSRLTDGIGADGVIITAATPSDEVISTAFRMCRRKGRVVLVGDVGLNLNRADFYAKELDFLVSTSYGPGRYDARYEEEGLDYPVAYVRWTENRNLSEYLRLIQGGRVRVAPLVSAVHPVDDAGAAYAALQGEGAKPLMVLLRYPAGEAAVPEGRVPNPRARTGVRDGKIGMAVVGAGGFARSMHLPNLLSLGDRYHLRAVVSRTGHNAVGTATQFGAEYSATDLQQVLDDDGVHAVLIATRHDLHARMALAALRAGKHVLLEKPLALTAEELAEIEAFYAAHPQGPVLLTGFNRRFSPYGVRMAELLAGRSNPFVASYRMNAGYLPQDHWVHGPQGGGRNRGEACHIYDLFTALAGSPLVSIDATAIRPATAAYARTDNFVATASFQDGSVASLAYTALGAKSYPKERMDLFFDGKTVVLDDYRSLEVHGARAKGVETKTAQKGQREELEAFAAAVRGGEWPIPLWQQVQATRMALEVEARLASPAPAEGAGR